ncbi:MAG: ATP-binding protein [Aggregatilineales bacterium]
MTKILVIEDEDQLRDEVAEWLTYEDFEVIIAKDGVEGANAAILHLPDVIICDIMMPRLDGNGVLLHVRANSLTQLIPFIFTTARVSHADIRSGMSLGADDYVTKPFTQKELLEAIQTQLDKRAVQKRELAMEVETWRQTVEEQREQSHLRVKMVGMFAHDFRNPLATIMTSISIVRDYADRLDEQRRLIHLNRAEASVRQLLEMLDDMLLFAQTDSDSYSLQMELVDVGQFVRHIVDDFQITHTETHKFLFENQFPLSIMTDSRLLRQIVANLISNAVKFSPSGSTVHIALEQDSDQCVLTVQDHGIGIPEADQSHLFSAFQRGSNVKGIGGTGLGLAIVQQSSYLLGGYVQLESQIGVGTTVIVHIPGTTVK